MKVNVTRTSNWDNDIYEVKEFNTIEELIEFSKEVKNPLILGTNFGGGVTVEIYDDWRE